MVRQRRFYCNNCKKAFAEHIIGIDRRSSTANFRDGIIKELVKGSINQAQRSMGVSSSLVYDVLKKHHEEQSIDWEEQGESITLGIDEHSHQGRKMALTVTNLTQQKLIQVCKNDRIATVEEFLKKVDKQRIKEVCIDMKRGFLYAIQRELPLAIVTVDKFHVIAAANKALDEVRGIIVDKRYHIRLALLKGKERLREREQQKLDHLFEEYKTFPSLAQAYFIKEKVREFYGSKDRQQAKERMEHLIMFCENTQSNTMHSFGRTLSRWQEYILNYFVYRSTNAYTEGVHTKIKMIKRMSFGFRNVDNYIAKITLAFLPLIWFNQHTVC